jgi:hypothetical protein
MTFGSTQPNMPYVVVVNRTNGTYHLLDMMRSLIDGKAAGKTLGFGAASAYIERSGRFVIIRNSASAPAGRLLTVWDLQTGTVYDATNQLGGTDTAGFGTLVNQSGYAGDQLEWSLRSLTASNIGNPSYLINPANLPTPHQSIYDVRMSWNNAEAGTLTPMFASIARNAQQTTQPWRAWDDEIVGVAADGSGTVWRFAHHRSLWSTNANDLPRGIVSQDGKWVVFTSNWDRKLGTDPSNGSNRLDVFVVELNRAASAPTVSITSPAANASVSGTTTVQATASDAGGIAGVQLKVDGANLGEEVKAAPYSASWNTAGLTGSHTLTAVARNNAGVTTTSAPVTVTAGSSSADKTPPTVSIASPANGSTVSGTVTITANASDNVGVTGVQFNLDGAALGNQLAAAPYSITWNTQGVAAGAHTMTAVARDAAGNRTTSAPVTLNVADVTPPTVAITSPANGATLSGAVALSATATDNVKVAGVQFLLNGAALGAEITAAPYTLSWNTASVANATYSITARARDASGNTATCAALSVKVANTTPVPAPAAPVLVSPAANATGVSTTSPLTWNASANATSYVVYFGTSAPPPQVTTTTSTSYAPGTLFAGTTYYWYVAAQNAAGTTAAATRSFTTLAPSGGVPPSGGTTPPAGGGTTPPAGGGTTPPAGGGSTLSYTSPYCGPSGGSTSWACGAWPSTTPPTLGPAGTTTNDPDTHNRVLRVTQSGSYGESAGTAFKAFDGGWKQAWNANSTRFFVSSWNGGVVKSMYNWVPFNAANMSVGSGTPVPSQFTDMEWDPNNPDLIDGIAGNVAKTYNVVTGAWTTVWDPATTNWGATPWLAGWGGNSVCIASGPQDVGYRLACYDRQAAKGQAIDLHAQTINGNKFTVYFQGQPVSLPSSIGIHTITMAPDGKFLAIDTHGNSLCSIGGLNNYASTALFINLQTNTAYEWNAACGQTHWAYGFNSVMAQSAGAKWTPAGPNGPCNSDSRGVLKRSTDAAIDSSVMLTEPCTFFNPATWNISVHLSWLNNVNDANANNYPVFLATTNEGVSNSFLWSDIAAMEMSAPLNQGRMWRFAQHWNDQYTTQCNFITYSSPAISRDGKWAIFPSDWRGQTGSNGVCTNGKRTDLFLFELK